MNRHTNHYANIDTGNEQWAGTARKAVHHLQMGISMVHRLRAFANPIDVATLDTILDTIAKVEKLTRTLPSLM